MGLALYLEFNLGRTDICKIQSPPIREYGNPLHSVMENNSVI